MLNNFHHFSGHYHSFEGTEVLICLLVYHILSSLIFLFILLLFELKLFHVILEMPIWQLAETNVQNVFNQSLSHKNVFSQHLKF